MNKDTNVEGLQVSPAIAKPMVAVRSLEMSFWDLKLEKSAKCYLFTDTML